MLGGQQLLDQANGDVRLSGWHAVRAHPVTLTGFPGAGRPGDLHRLNDQASRSGDHVCSGYPGGLAEGRSGVIDPWVSRLRSGMWTVR
jgi:hypothetical protein